MKTEARIEIDRPVELVFQLTNDHVPEWSEVVVEEEMLEKKPGGVGSRFRTVTADRGRRMDFDGTVTQFDPPVLSAVELTGKSFDIEAEYQFEDLGGGRTCVTQTSVVRPKGFMKVMFFLLGWMMKSSSCKAVQKELESLKAFCETDDS